MGVLTEYFIATSDGAASEVLSWPSGPSGGPRAVAARSGMLRRFGRASGRSSSVRMDSVVDGGGVEPVLQMLVLEAILTGRSEEDIEDDRAGDEFIAGEEVDGPSVVKLSHELTVALRRASARELVDAAGTWASVEEFDGATDAGTLAALLDRLADLARSAEASGARLYCWVSS